LCPDEDLESEEADRSRTPIKAQLIATSLEPFASRRGLIATTYRGLGLDPKTAVEVETNYSPLIHGLRVQFLMVNQHGEPNNSKNPIRGAELILPCTADESGEEVLCVPVYWDHDGVIWRFLSRKLQMYSKLKLQHLQSMKRLLMVNSYFTSIAGEVSHLGALLGIPPATVEIEVDDGAIVDPAVLGLQGSHKQASPWRMSRVPPLKWGYFDEFEGSVDFAIATVPTPVLTVEVKHWRRLDLLQPQQDSIDPFKCDPPRYVKKVAEVEKEPQTLKLRWLDKKVLQITFHKTEELPKPGNPLALIFWVKLDVVTGSSTIDSDMAMRVWEPQQAGDPPPVSQVLAREASERPT
jgi:hypothetical protein